MRAKQALNFGATKRIAIAIIKLHGFFQVLRAHQAHRPAWRESARGTYRPTETPVAIELRHFKSVSAFLKSLSARYSNARLNKKGGIVAFRFNCLSQVFYGLLMLVHVSGYERTVKVIL